jgi:raffinose/stachyose/melibiose transport system substrate-binding protein
LSFAHWRAEDRKVFDEVIASFVRANPGASVRQDISPSNDYQSTALRKVQGGAIGDVFTAFRGSQFVDMVKAGLFTDLSPQTFTDNYLPKLVRGGKDIAGRQLGLPYQLVFNMPVANVALLEKAGVSEPPPDWDGFLAMCEKLKSRGTAALAWPGGEPANAGQLLNAMVMNNAPWDDMFARIESGTAKATDDWFVTTLRQYAQLRPYFQPNATGASSEPCQQLFARGRAAMLATGSFHLGPVRQLGATFPVDMIAPITVPKGKARYQGIYNATFILGVNTGSHHAEAATAFVRHLSTPEVATRYANETTQHVTVADATYTNKDLRATAHWLTAPTLLAPRFQFDDLDMRAAVENAAVAVVGGTAPEQAAEAAQKTVDQRRRA